MTVNYSIASPYFNTIFPSLCIIRLFRDILLQDNNDFSSFSLHLYVFCSLFCLKTENDFNFLTMFQFLKQVIRVSYCFPFLPWFRKIFVQSNKRKHSIVGRNFPRTTINFLRIVFKSSHARSFSTFNWIFVLSSIVLSERPHVHGII